MSQNPRMGREQSEASSAVSLALSFSLGSSLLQFLLEVTFPGFSFVSGVFLLVGVISPRRFPDDGGGFPDGSIPNVFQGEVSLAFQLKLTWSSFPALSS